MLLYNSIRFVIFIKLVNIANLFDSIYVVTINVCSHLFCFISVLLECSCCLAGLCIV